jgi:hypothetical protein
MAFPYPTEDARVRVSATEGGTYATLGRATRFTMDGGTEGGGTTRYFGGEIEKAGDATLEGACDFIRDRSDTTGQERIRDAWLSGDSVFIQYGPEGIAAYDDVEQFEAKITAFNEDMTRDNDWVTGSFSFRAIVSTLQTITLA